MVSRQKVGSETEDVVPIVHMTHFCQLGTGLALSWCVPWDPLGVRLVRPFQF